jgi:hypothetical protein
LSPLLIAASLLFACGVDTRLNAADASAVARGALEHAGVTRVRVLATAKVPRATQQGGVRELVPAWRVLVALSDGRRVTLYVDRRGDLGVFEVREPVGGLLRTTAQRETVSRYHADPARRRRARAIAGIATAAAALLLAVFGWMRRSGAERGPRTVV